MGPSIRRPWGYFPSSLGDRNETVRCLEGMEKDDAMCTKFVLSWYFLACFNREGARREEGLGNTISEVLFFSLLLYRQLTN